MINKSYEELIKEDEYKWIASILLNDNDARKDNRVLLKKFYWLYFGLTLDQAFSNDSVPNYQTVDRKARLLKAVNHKLRYDKSELVDMYKQIALEKPVAIQLF